ncbi:acyl-CoA N-acyltransferase [Trichoderma sp. SZMC 28015]
MSSSNNRLSVSVQPLNYADVHACAQITSDAFAIDPHTIVKGLGRKPYDMYDIMRSMLLDGLERKKQIYVKAVDEETGEIVGHAGWAFKDVDEAAIPWSRPSDDKSAAKEEPRPKKDEPENEDTGDIEEKREEDSIDRLKALESRDMQYWQTNIIPQDKPCVFITGLHVSVSHQSRGVGTVMLQYGNAIADKLGLTIWVHSSHQAYEAYQKAGFEAVKELDLDLDEWAPRGPRVGEAVMGDKGSEKWGRYIIRYMKRDPK